MSAAARGWRMSERVLLGAVLVFAALAIYRFASKAPGHGQTMPGPSTQEAQAVPSRPGAVTGPPPGPACTELLARIRSCSEKDLDGIIDAMSGLEAYRLYHQLTAAERETVFAALPLPVMARKAESLLGIPASSFRHSHRPELLATSLIDAAMGAPAVAAGRPGELVFAGAVDGQGAPMAPRPRFRPDERRIHACLDGGEDPAGDAGVLVRWTAEDSGSLVYFRYLPLALNRRWNHVYFEVESPWAPGAYRVAFYRIAATASLLAEGRYEVGTGD